MQTTVEATDKHTVKLTIEVPADQVDKDLDLTYRSIAREIKIPGFRPGKAPKPIIDAQVGIDVVLEEFVHQSVPSYFRTAVSDEDLAPIGDPDVDVEQLEPGKAFIFTATVEVRPRLELTKEQYEGVKVVKPSTVPTEEDIDGWIERLQRQFAELEPVDRPAQDTDLVTVSLSAARDGVPLDQLTREEYLYSIGSGEFGPAMDAKLVGTKPGDIVEFDEDLPVERFGEELAGSASFKVLVKDVKALRLPEADDAFASTASEFDTIAELREDLREKLQEVKEREAVGVVRDRVLQAMVDTVDAELPESLIDDETTHRVQHAEQQAARYGLTLDQMLEMQGWDRARLAEDSRDHAVRAIKADLVLEGVARSEELDVTAEEIGVQIGQMAQAYDRDPKELAKQLDRSGQIVTLAGDIIRSKALDILVERADITEESPEAVDAGASRDPADEPMKE
ncbi:MAG TPA: trigger factor [Actinomycetota bacterium]|nr:trigger factor [Actinomycetota bacterium]